MPTKVIRSRNPKIVLFYSMKSPFSNFHPAEFRVEVDGGMKEFNCSEQYFMYHKARLAKDVKSAEEILKMTKPLLMKRAGRKLKMSQEMLKEWSEASEDVMFRGCLQKFRQNEKLQISLFRTRGMRLAEASPRDKLWGIGLGVNDKRAGDCSLWKGKNKLGKVLEKVRDELWENSEEEFRKSRDLVEKEDDERRCGELEKI